MITVWIVFVIFIALLGYKDVLVISSMMFNYF